eukprot:scaffold601616_cov41-Prasinocladus_malaysianus.AAC.1
MIIERTRTSQVATKSVFNILPRWEKTASNKSSAEGHHRGGAGSHGAKDEARILNFLDLTIAGDIFNGRLVRTN